MVLSETLISNQVLSKSLSSRDLLRGWFYTIYEDCENLEILRLERSRLFMKKVWFGRIEYEQIMSKRQALAWIHDSFRLCFGNMKVAQKPSLSLQKINFKVWSASCAGVAIVWWCKVCLFPSGPQKARKGESCEQSQHTADFVGKRLPVGHLEFSGF